jgi:hypothetical protein
MKENQTTALPKIGGVEAISDLIYELNRAVALLQAAREIIIGAEVPAPVQTDGLGETGKEAPGNLPGCNGVRGAARRDGARSEKATRKRKGMCVDVRRAQTPTVTEPPEEAPEPGSDEPTTLAKAMKVLARELAQPFTLADMLVGLKTKPEYAALLEKAGATSPESNLRYWSKVGHVNKTGEGAAALYRNVKF